MFAHAIADNATQHMMCSKTNDENGSHTPYSKLTEENTEENISEWYENRLEWL